MMRDSTAPTTLQFFQEVKMKALVSSTLLVLCVLGYSSLAGAEEAVRVRPVDIYISGFGGYSHPFKTDISFGGLELHDVKLDSSPSFGGKIGMWITAPRKTLGIDVGVEVDVTNFNPDASSGQVLSSNIGPGTLVSTLDFNATYFGISVLARLPMDVTPELPNGRWFPYIGLGGGGQRLTLQGAGTSEGRNTVPAFQGLGGAKIFITKNIAAFAEGKFIHASHSMGIVGGGTIDLTLNSVHGVVGLSLHF
jgi:opacity protein-like surface antigen